MFETCPSKQKGIRFYICHEKKNKNPSSGMIYNKTEEEPDSFYSSSLSS